MTDSDLVSRKYENFESFLNFLNLKHKVITILKIRLFYIFFTLFLAIKIFLILKTSFSVARSDRSIWREVHFNETNQDDSSVVKTINKNISIVSWIVSLKWITIHDLHILQRLMYVANWSYSTSTWLSFHNVMVKSDYLIYLTNSISYRSFTLQNFTTGMTDVTKKEYIIFNQMNWYFLRTKYEFSLFSKIYHIDSIHSFTLK